MAKYNRLFSLDKDTEDFLDTIPKMKRSEVVREGIKLYKNLKKTQENIKKSQKPLPEVRIIG